MKTYTLREIVDELRKNGHRVTYRARNDGSIVITSIDGVSFSQKAGNKRARDMTNKQMTDAQRNQRQVNIPRASEGRKSKLPSLTKTQKKNLKKINRVIKKTGSGRLSNTKARKVVTERGWKGIAEEASKIIRRNLNIVNDGLVDSAIAKASEWSHKGHSTIMALAVGEMNKQHSMIVFEHFESILQLLYSIEKFARERTKGNSFNDTMQFLQSDEFRMYVDSCATGILQELQMNKEEYNEIIKDLDPMTRKFLK